MLFQRRTVLLRALFFCFLQEDFDILIRLLRIILIDTCIQKIFVLGY